MKKSSKTVFKNLNIINTRNRKIERNDLLVKGDKIIDIGKIKDRDAEIIDCDGMFAAPGLVDIHTHLREPGFEYKETIDTASMAAVNGGFVAITGMANTKPAVDTAGTVRYVLERGKDADFAKVYTYGAVTKNLEGKELAEINDLAREGVIGLSDDGNPITDPSLLLRALKYVKMFDLPIVLHEEDLAISEDGVMHEGNVQAKLGMAGIPDLAEDTMTYRDLRIAEYVNGKVHITHVSSKNTLDVIKFAKDRGVKVTCDVTPHHLLLNDSYIETFNTNYKMKPPLRSENDRLALIEGIRSGLIDIIATDHAPHAIYEKEVEFNYAPFGVTGLETAFPVLYSKLVETNTIDVFKLFELMNKNPVDRFNIDIPTTIKKGGNATFIVFNKGEWTIDEHYFKSKSRNNAFLGDKVGVKVIHTLIDGDFKMKNGEIKKGA